MERTPAHAIDSAFPKRWSPRAFTGEKLAEGEIRRLFEAARWAPSSLNRQPWRFVYGLRETPAFESVFSLVMPFNQVWCAKASALIAIFAKTKSDTGEEWGTAVFDCGAAWMSIALQAQMQGLMTHGMAGIHVDKANETLSAPADWRLQAIVAVGKQAPVETLPDEKLRGREQPSDRQQLSSLVFEGSAKAVST